MNKNQVQIARNTRFFLGLIFALSTQSCSSLNNMFYWADTYIAWQVDSYFDLTDEQDVFVEQHLNQLLMTYRLQELPKYIDFLKEVKSRTANPLMESDLLWVRKMLSQFNETIARLLADDASLFLMSLNGKQVLHLEQKLAEENDDWLEEHKKREEQSESKKLDHVYEGIEKWVGDLNADQKQRISELYHVEGVTYNAWYQRRLQSQQQFLEILHRGYQNRVELRDILLDWYLNAEQHYSPEYKEYQQKRDERTTRLVLMLSQTVTDKQRTYFYDKVESYIHQLEKIIAH